ncbi:MAG: AAA family ATPase [Caldilineaceae bacterium]|nr:AAA family ATPase [Caldilineaceae bacterium]
MDEIRLKNYRCFREDQTARLAPLTLLVGENSTGKTSFLAIIRALWEFANDFRVPDFKEEPYDLGSFDEIAHFRGGRGGRAETFIAGISTTRSNLPKGTSTPLPQKFDVTFGKVGTVPFPVGRQYAFGDTRIEDHFEEDIEENHIYVLRVKTPRGRWEKRVSRGVRFSFQDRMAPPHLHFSSPFNPGNNREGDPEFEPLNGSPSFGSEDYESLQEFPWFDLSYSGVRPFASAPVRSRPRRTYDPSRPTRDPEGDYVPMYLADVFTRRENRWAELRRRLQEFGKASGLFDEIFIKRLGGRDSEPFQLQIRKSGSKLKGPLRNLIDVGYGVSQALLVITELLRPDAPPLFLLQQPEVHLHPSAQAALGSLFCQIANRERQIIVETHSDNLIDRVRMDVRDGEGSLKPEDVSILFFERDGLDVRIHSLEVDDAGNVINAPDSYRSFFMEETTRSLGL